MAESNTLKSRKRRKLQCMNCKKEFDDDYKTIHMQKYHGRKLMQVQIFGAVKNPFDAAKALAKKRRLNDQETTSNASPSTPLVNESAVTETTNSESSLGRIFYISIIKHFIFLKHKNNN